MGVHLDERRDATLGHRRLAIIDPSGGAQPILDAGSSAALVANGMIYNDAELRHELGEDVFATATDSEAILHALSAWGTDAVARLDGMFAFVLVHEDGLIAARDPIGIKPLYMGRIDDCLCFASEIKALANVAVDIEEFPAGQVFDSRSGFRTYYQPPEALPEVRPHGEMMAALRDTLDAAVTKRLRSDVPLGAFLSGGLDSSIIAALARQKLDELHTFAVGLEGSADLLAARRVAEHLDTIHHEHVITRDEVRRDLPEILFHLESFDRDLVRSAIPCWYVSRLASERVKVVLTGEGADELFAGYDRYKLALYGDRLSRYLPAGIRRRLGGLQPRAENWRRLVRVLGEETASARFLEVIRLFSDEEMRSLGLVPASNGLPSLGDGDVLSEFQRFDVRTLLPNDFFMKADKMA
ncbi:MAG: asparagine synthase (glutamine-hydrolyzing), partial [Alphaproteobacteria bacterium]|nr:asparagine synthase (glutamine-hydrolyzing) [Alphaproteobacteria bacterium]